MLWCFDLCFSPHYKQRAPGHSDGNYCGDVMMIMIMIMIVVIIIIITIIIMATIGMMLLMIMMTLTMIDGVSCYLWFKYLACITMHCTIDLVRIIG